MRPRNEGRKPDREFGTDRTNKEERRSQRDLSFEIEKEEEKGQIMHAEWEIPYLYEICQYLVSTEVSISIFFELAPVLLEEP